MARIDRDKALEELRGLFNGDPEAGHLRADRILLDLIDDDEIREAFDAIDKWYA
jgi:hypothetical protein